MKPIGLKTLNDLELLTQTKRKVQEELTLTQEILHHLREIEDRRLYAKRGYSSLFEMCVKEFKYSHSAAQRRISAMRLARELPEVEEKMKEGKLNLSTVSQAQSFFRSERRNNNKIYDKAQKSEILKNLENKSTREAQRTLLKISPQSLPKERQRALTESHTEIKIVIDQDLKNTLEELKLHYSHVHPNMTYGELLKKIVVLAKESLTRKNPGSNFRRRALPAREKVKNDPHTRAYIPKSIRQHVWKRDGGCCTYRDPLTKRKCESKFQLELDHKIPIAMGGESSTDNLRLLCKEHNQLEALRQFGRRKMDPYRTRHI